METFLPILILLVVVYMVVNYAKAVLYRRNHILPKVERLLDDENVSLYAKFMVSHAFLDSLDYTLPIKIQQAFTKVPSVELKKANKSSERFIGELDASTKKAVFEILDECIKLNFRLAFPLYLYALWRYPSSKVNKKVEHVKVKKVVRRQAKKALVSYATEDYSSQLNCA